jgi:hypothetical protein
VVLRGTGPRESRVSPCCIDVNLLSLQRHQSHIHELP